MESFTLLWAAPSVPFPPTPPASRPSILIPTSRCNPNPNWPRPRRPPAALRNPRGFGPPSQKTKKPKKRAEGSDDDDDDDEEEEEEEEGLRSDVTIPEVVTNRMMQRMGLSVGIPLATGLLFFPFFYYLKVGAKIDVPTWIPLIVSFFFFGTALLGVSYGIVSASWDPLREGSLLGWNEARRNWPIFWQSIMGGSGKK